MANIYFEIRTDPSIIKQLINSSQCLWNKVYDNAVAVVKGQEKPDFRVNIAYLEIKRDLATLTGDIHEEGRLNDLRRNLERSSSTSSAERRRGY
ncbi:MAG: hypothetical protein Q7R97_04880 [Candidatus Daviesbacteria bacterium]|nr:hypothetical protein [Candidatus Daviesbacteria bacterium]